MAPKVRSQFQAKAKSKATASRPGAQPLWRYEEVEAVYLSKVNKTPASFLNLTANTIACWNVDIDSIGIFNPTKKHGNVYPILRVLLKSPANTAAERILEDGDASAIVRQIWGPPHDVISHDLLVRKCRRLKYPLF